MEGFFLEYGNLLLRWLHVIAAIAWIGESIYFVMLDLSLHAPKGEHAKKWAYTAKCGPCTAAASTITRNT